uniref:Large ribosomal subunit protein bL34m n=1 Tax=Homalodisca liturata TaxID=320908 RepID=A0A1B6H5K7_9HEMI
MYFLRSVFPSIKQVLSVHQSMPTMSYIGQACWRNGFHSVANTAQCSSILSRLNGLTGSGAPGGSWSLISVRNNIRNNFPRPSEVKRQRLNFWNRMKTRGGRAVLMRRYLKGRHVLSH